MSTVLIVDDMQTDRDLLGKVVLASGNQPAYATNGQEALRKAVEVKPALILLDVVMPGIDGFSACRQLKRNAETAAIPVVLITLKGTASDVFWGKKQGADDHLTKPFTTDRLMSIIRRFAP